MPTMVARLVVETSESLARRVVSRTYASWPAASFTRQVVSLAAGASVTLPSATTFIVEADGVAAVTLSWQRDVVVQLPLSGLAVVTVGSALTLTNGAPAGAPPVPVAVTSF